MNQEHHHNHQHTIQITHINKAFIIGICFNFLFVIVEVIVGISIDSLSLLSDAGHNLIDVFALALSLLAYRLLQVKPNDRYTYGYRKISILTALFNAFILLVSIGAITYEAINRFFYPKPLPGITIAIVAGIGIAINAFTALLFFREKEKDINIKSAYLHLMSDAIVSLGIVVGGIIIYYTHWYWLDAIFSIIIAIIILLSTWSLLKDSLRLSLDGVPSNINLQQIKKIILETEGVLGISHLHIWAISTTQNALTVNLIIDENKTIQQMQEIKAVLKHSLAHCNIQHSTLEIEIKNISSNIIGC